MWEPLRHKDLGRSVVQWAWCNEPLPPPTLAFPCPSAYCKRKVSPGSIFNPPPPAASKEFQWPLLHTLPHKTHCIVHLQVPKQSEKMHGVNFLGCKGFGCQKWLVVRPEGDVVVVPTVGLKPLHCKIPVLCSCANPQFIHTMLFVYSGCSLHGAGQKLVSHKTGTWPQTVSFVVA